MSTIQFPADNGGTPWAAGNTYTVGGRTYVFVASQGGNDIWDLQVSASGDPAGTDLNTDLQNVDTDLTEAEQKNFRHAIDASEGTFRIIAGRELGDLGFDFSHPAIPTGVQTFTMTLPGQFERDQAISRFFIPNQVELVDDSITNPTDADFRLVTNVIADGTTGIGITVEDGTALPASTADDSNIDLYVANRTSIHFIEGGTFEGNTLTIPAGGDAEVETVGNRLFERILSRGRQFGFDHNGVEYRGGFGDSISGTSSFTTVDGALTHLFSVPIANQGYFTANDYAVFAYNNGYRIEQVQSVAPDLINPTMLTVTLGFVAGRAWADDSPFAIGTGTINNVQASAVRNLRAVDNPRAFLVELKGMDNVIGRDDSNNTTFLYTRDDDGQQFNAVITSVAFNDASITGLSLPSAPTSGNVTVFTYRTGGTVGMGDVVAVKRIYTRADSATGIDVREV